MWYKQLLKIICQNIKMNIYDSIFYANLVVNAYFMCSTNHCDCEASDVETSSPTLPPGESGPHQRMHVDMHGRIQKTFVDLFY